MRVGILSYPMLFQRDGGLQVQVRATIAALREASLPGLEVELVDPNQQRLDDYDLVHVFSAINGNYRVVELATELGVPVVLSALLSPSWNRGAGWRANLAERLTGRLTQWNVQTSYAQTKRALQLADLIIALGGPERQALMDGYDIEPARIRLLPNGVSEQFFTANAEAFVRHTGLKKPFVLMVGAISPYKNQLGVAEALAKSQLPIVLIGQAQRHDQDYLQKLLATPKVRWLGQLEHRDPLLASAYAAATVLALPSQGEVFPLVVLEALAAGTPVVMSDESALSLPDSAFALQQLRWYKTDALCAAIESFIGKPPPRPAVRALVQGYTWQRVALRMADFYAQVLERRQQSHGRRDAV
jgi:glycosyltransferase involved in cell wall biosynthesis